MSVLGFLILLILLPLCGFIPGFVIVRRFRWTHLEKICGSIVLSLVIVYLTAAIVYSLNIDWRWCWVFTGLWSATAVLYWRDLRRFATKKCVRDPWLAFGIIFLCGLLLLLLIQHYSGGSWGLDWLEHFHRTIFFLRHLPFDTEFIGLYPLPARPPMTHLVTAYILAQAGGEFDHFQIIFLFLNALAFFPCLLLAEWVAPSAGRRTWLTAVFLLTCPMVVQNITYSWNKLSAAFFVLCSITFYLRGWKRGDTGRLVLSAISMAAAILTHYSAGPYAVFLALHYLFVVPKKKWALFWSSGAAVGLMTTWFAWSVRVYGVVDTFMTNTTVTETGKLTWTENALTFFHNIYYTFVPHPIRTSSEQFGVLFEQPNRFGYVRDYFFNLFQTNLPLSLGLLGWLVALRVTYKKLGEADASIRRFWICFIIVLIILGVAVLGVSDQYGVTHICLQAVSLIGRVMLAVGFVSLGSKLRLALIFSMTADIVLGILLQCRMQMQAVRSFSIGQMTVVPLSPGLLGVQAVLNSIARFKNSLAYLADYGSPISGFILAIVILIFGAILVWLTYFSYGEQRRPKQRLYWCVAAVLCAYLAGTGITMCDRWLGFSVAPALPMANAMQQELTVSLQKVNTQHESPEAMTALGEVYYQLGQLEEANTAFENAVLLNPNDAKAHYLHGLTRAINRLSFADGDTMRAVFLRIYRDNVRTYINYGRMLYDRNFRHKSVEVLAGVVQKYPNDAISHQALAMALFGTGEHEHGIDEMKIAHRLDPNSTQISNELNVMLGMKANQ